MQCTQLWIVAQGRGAICLAQTEGTGKRFSTMTVAFSLDLKITVNLSHNRKDGERNFSFQACADRKFLLTITVTSLYIYQMRSKQLKRRNWISGKKENRVNI